MNILIASPIFSDTIQELRKQNDVVCAYKASEEELSALMRFKVPMRGFRVTRSTWLAICTTLMLFVDTEINNTGGIVCLR